MCPSLKPWGDPSRSHLAHTQTSRYRQCPSCNMHVFAMLQLSGSELLSWVKLCSSNSSAKSTVLVVYMYGVQQGVLHSCALCCHCSELACSTSGSAYTTGWLSLVTQAYPVCPHSHCTAISKA
jgi:alkylhydroperoxidase family enzyme